MDVWVPDRVLCKRFGVAAPSEDLRKRAEEKDKK